MVVTSREIHCITTTCDKAVRLTAMVY